jgi:cytochrome oxidase Cu insertion factor (SCO1/SenC/PrrC family)
MNRPPVLLVATSVLGLWVGCVPSPTDERSAAPRPVAAPVVVAASDSPDRDCCKAEAADPPPASAPKVPPVEIVTSGVTVPDMTLIDQDGRPVNVARDLAAGKLLVLNVIFTTCKGVCPPMAVNFAKLQQRLGDRLGRDVNLVSVSIDPVNDTPERLKAWARQFGALPGWTLLTGPKQDVDRLLRSLGSFSADRSQHTPFVLVGRASKGVWRRIHGLTPTDTLAEMVLGMLKPGTDEPSKTADRGDESGTSSAARDYFTDVPLVDQNGVAVKLYSDILKGKVVVITPFFTSCRASCPRLIETFSKLQAYYGDRVGKDLFLVSLTVDPETDTPARLKAYAGQVHASKGWSFLTGDRKNVDTALAKLGHRMKGRDDHSNIYIIGNESTGLWKKALGLAPPEEIVKIVDSVLNDERL